MTFLPETLCLCLERVDESFSGALTLRAGGVWAGVVSSGRCGLDGRDVGPGDFFLGAGPLTLAGAGECHAAAVRLGGTAAEGLEGEASRVVAGEHCPACGELLVLLLTGEPTPARASSLGYALLCELWEAEERSKGLPPLAEEAVALMREDYATLYGVEEVADRLGVSKCHLVRVFSKSVGTPPGRYLTAVRLEAAKELLLLREYSLETVAGLCGFSGANYFCRVFRREEGTTPTAWLSAAGIRRRAGRDILRHKII